MAKRERVNFMFIDDDNKLNIEIDPISTTILFCSLMLVLAGLVLRLLWH